MPLPWQWILPRPLRLAPCNPCHNKGGCAYSAQPPWKLIRLWMRPYAGTNGLLTGGT